MVLGGDGGVLQRGEIPVPEVCLGQDEAAQDYSRLQGARLCTTGKGFEIL